MEVYVVENTQKIIIAVEAVQQQIGQMGKRVNRLETKSHVSTNEQSPGQKKTTAGYHQPRQLQKTGDNATRYRRFQIKWSNDCNPIRNYCKEAGHMYRAYPNGVEQLLGVLIL